MFTCSGRLHWTAIGLLALPVSVAADPPEPKAKLEHDGPVNIVAFSPDGKLLAAGDRASTIRLWNAMSGKLVHKMSIAEGEFLSLSFAPDGKTLASTSSDGWIRLWDVETGKEIREFRAESDRYWRFVAFAGDGRTVITGRNSPQVTFWDSSTAKETNHFPSSQDDRLIAGGLRGLAVLPNCQTIILLTVYGESFMNSPDPPPPHLRLLSLATGKELRKFPIDGGTHLALSADGKTVAVSNDRSNRQERLVLLEPATGQKRTTYKERTSAIAFSPDSRFLAAADPKNNFVMIRDLITGKSVLRLEEHEAEITSLAFSPDGQRLASASGDFSVLLWDTSGLVKRPLPEIQMSDAEMQAGWEAFAKEDAAKAFQVRNQFVQANKQALPFLKDKLNAVSLFDPKRMAQLIRDLDSNRFAARQQAIAELEQLGVQAEAALHKVLDGKPSLEVRRRVEDLLQRIGSPNLGPEQLRVVRAVEVLELAGTPEALAILETFAKPEPPSFLTLEARAALKRLARLKGN